MKPLITSPRALRELATGLSEKSLQTMPKLFIASYENSDVLLTIEDGPDTALVLVWRENFGKDAFIPSVLAPYRRGALSRMASFAERAGSAQLSLPFGWHQYKHENLVSFFAVPGNDSPPIRWVAERINKGPGLTVFWQVETDKSPSRLEDLKPKIPPFPASVFDDWEAALVALKIHLSNVRGAAEAEVYLPHRPSIAPQDESMSGWLGVASPDQLSFINASTDRSIRLRGPAGSGKTLALTLKAAREVLRARQDARPIRVLVATHSWALASQITHNLDKLGLGQLDEVDVFPLTAVAEALSPHTGGESDQYTIVGDDSESGKRAQLNDVLDVLTDFLATDWITYRATISPALRDRFDSKDSDELFALAWDLLTEFGSVIGAAGIFPGAGAEARYAQTPRSAWMLQLSHPADFRVVFRLYTAYMKNLDDRQLITTDQVMADFLGYLSTHSWNRNRRTLGYDLIFVDEFHLFSPLERQVMHFLTSDVSRYPRIFMALDPRQSPSAVYIGMASDSTTSGAEASTEDVLGEVANLELTNVHRFTPEILRLVEHVHHEFPAYALGDDWEIDFSQISSSKDSGPVPSVTNSGSQEAEENEIARAAFDLYSKGRLAIAVVDSRLWPRYQSLAEALGRSPKHHVSMLTARADIDDIGYRHRGIVIGTAEHLAGLQFTSVLVVGLPGLSPDTPHHDRRRLVSSLYLAISRAESEVRIFTNDSNGGMPDVLSHAITEKLATYVKGPAV